MSRTLRFGLCTSVWSARSWLLCVLVAGHAPAAWADASAPASQSTTGISVPLIPREVLFGNPERYAPRLSPDGTRMAYLAPVDGVLNVWLGEANGLHARPVTQDTDRGIHRYFFAQDNRHLLYQQDTGGDENWRLYGLDLQTGDIRDYTPFDGVQVRVIAFSVRQPGALLLAMNKDDPRIHDVYRLDLATGDLTLDTKNPGDVAEWVTDPDLRVLGAMRTTPDGGQELQVRDTPEAPWRTLITWGLEDSMASEPKAFTQDGRRLIMRDSRGRDTAALVSLDMASGEMMQLAADPAYDVSFAMLDRRTNEPDVAVIIRERPEWVILNDDLRPDLARVRKLAPGNMSLSSRTRDNRRWIVSFAGDTRGAHHYLYDRTAGEATPLFEETPALNAYVLAPMESFAATARDGLTLHGYLTFPPGVPRTNLPTVLRVHGGPWSRNAWGLNSRVQWLANRGYLCVDVNFRGSTGYGKAFVNAGDREWGGKMHDDLIDTVRWVVERGYADPERIGIYGGSYGGYAALVGAAFTPDVFACAVDVVGPSNLITLLQSVPPYWEPYRAVWTRRVGDPVADAEFLKSRSPLFHVDRIRIPVLIAQGANDPRVKRAEAEQIVAAMRERGLDYEYLLFPDEGHGFAKPKNRMTFTAAAERFLAKHLGGRYEPVKQN